MNVHLRQCAYSSTCEYFGMITLNKSKEYNLLRTHAQKRQKSVKRKYCGKGGYYTLACDATYEVIEDLLNVPMSKLKLTPAKNGFCNEVFEVEYNDHTKAIVKVYSDASKIRMEPSERGKFDGFLCNIGISPDVIAISELGIAHAYINGSSMTEVDIHSDDKFSKKLAKMYFSRICLNGWIYYIF